MGDFIGAIRRSGEPLIIVSWVGAESNLIEHLNWIPAFTNMMFEVPGKESLISGVKNVPLKFSQKDKPGKFEKFSLDPDDFLFYRRCIVTKCDDTYFRTQIIGKNTRAGTIFKKYAV